VNCLLHANVLEIVPDASSGEIKNVRVTTFNGNEFKVSAKVFVLAASGIENARILLNSNSVQKSGIGNQNDVVGRYFMEHPVIEPYFIPANDKVNVSLYHYWLRTEIGENKSWAMLSPSEDYLRKNRQLGAGISFSEAISVAVQSIDEVKKYLRGKSKEDLTKHIKNILNDLDGVASYGYHRKVRGKRRYEMKSDLFLFSTLLEMVPDADNRVVLSEDRDSLGQRRSEFHLRLTETDKQSDRKLFEMFSKEFGVENESRLF